MSLFLSRVALSPYSPKAMALAGSPGELHRMVVALLDGREDSSFLFRVDPGERGPDLLIQSKTEPKWDRLGLEDRDLRDEPATKPLSFDVEPGTALSFRLLARPVRRTSTGKGNAPGPRRDLRTDEERLAWLHRKGDEGGFGVTMCGLTTMTFAAVHSGLSLRAKGGSFTAVRFDGELVVTDAEALQEAVAQGIGTQKAFGFGLLSLGKS